MAYLKTALCKMRFRGSSSLSYTKRKPVAIGFPAPFSLLFRLPPPRVISSQASGNPLPFFA